MPRFSEFEFVSGIAVRGRVFLSQSVAAATLNTRPVNPHIS